ncbi:MAG: hypothetical protein ACXVHY_03165 [Methanobacterium sp.]
MEKQLNKTRVNIIKTIKDRKRVEMEFLAAVKRQMGYWKNQLENTDPENDKERYLQLKDNVEMEKKHIKQIEEELDRINEEIKLMQKR